jgi:hypothetical protein
MDKKISFFVLNTTGSPVKQLTVSKALLKVLSLLLMFALIVSGYVVYDYYTLKIMLPSSTQVKSKIDNQEDEIVSQRQQIQNFAHEINTLKTKLIDLNRFEKKIRIIANIEKSSSQDGLFGVGGSVPEDLNPNIELESKHNRLVQDIHEQVEQLNVASVN